MKPAPFEYHRAATLPEGLELMAQHGRSGRVLAGGQSLMPLLNARKLRPDHLIDINPVAELDHVAIADSTVTVGAMVRQEAALRNPGLELAAPMLADALRHVASPTVRNRGTICGSIAHAQPAAELPAVAVAMGGEVVAQHRDTGERSIDIGDFFEAPFVTALREGELLTEIRLKRWPDTVGHAFLELSRVRWPVVSVAVLVQLSNSAISCCSIALAGVAGVPVRAHAVEDAVRTEIPTAASLAAAAEHATDGLDVLDNVLGGAEYRAQVARVLVNRALGVAVDRAREAA